MSWRVILLSVASLSCLPPRAEHHATTAPIVVPVEIRNGLVVVHATVNGHDALLVLDTGSGISVLDTAFAREAGIRSAGGSAEVKGTAGASAALGTADSVRLGGALLTSFGVAAVSLDALRERVGRDIRGTLGFDVFDQYVVDIDYGSGTLTLLEAPAYEYKGAGAVLPLSLEHRIPVLEATIETRKVGALPARLHLDLGSSGYALRLATTFVRAHDLANDTTALHGLLGVGVGGVIEGELMRLPALSLGKFAIHRPSAALSNETGGAFGLSADADGAIGAPVWSRMHVIIDYSRARVILEPRGNFTLPDPVSNTGISVAADDRDPRLLRAAYVIQGSAGADAGVHAGDEILAIDGRAASAMSVADANTALRDAHPRTRLKVRRAAYDSTLTLAPRPTF